MVCYRLRGYVRYVTNNSRITYPVLCLHQHIMTQPSKRLTGHVPSQIITDGFSQIPSQIVRDGFDWGFSERGPIFV